MVPFTMTHTWFPLPWHIHGLQWHIHGSFYHDTYMVPFTTTHTWFPLPWHIYGSFYHNTYIVLLLWHILGSFTLTEPWPFYPDIYMVPLPYIYMSLLPYTGIVLFTMTHTFDLIWFDFYHGTYLVLLSWHMHGPFYCDIYMIPFTMTQMAPLSITHKWWSISTWQIHGPLI